MNLEDRVLARRRLEESKLNALQSAVQENFHLGSIAKWEQSSTKLMSSKQYEREQANLKRQRAMNLEARKESLRTLLTNEELAFQKEIDCKSETAQQRRERLEKKAKELRAKRIKHREAFVAKQRVKQFREQCDELRLNHGRNLTKECDRIRRQQMKERQQQQEYERSLESQHLAIWQQELQQKMDRERQESEHKKKLNNETAKGIREQMMQLQLQRSQQEQEKTKEAQLRVRALEDQKELQKQQESETRQALQRKREEMRAEYEEYTKRKLQQQENEKKLDQAFVREILEKEQQESVQQMAKQTENKNDAHNYLLYLQRLRESEQEKEALLEKLRQTELEKAWSKRETQWSREKLARQQLLQNVVEERRDQIAYKRMIQENSSQDTAYTADKLRRELQEYETAEQEKEASRLKYNQEIQQFLQKQMAEKKQAAAPIASEDANNVEQNNEAYHEMLKQEMEKDTQAMQNGQSSNQYHYPKTAANWWTF